MKPKGKHIKKVLKEFDEKFLYSDKFNSREQFNPKLKGRLYQEFRSFLTQAIKDERNRISVVILEEIEKLKIDVGMSIRLTEEEIKQEEKWNQALNTIKERIEHE